MIDQVKKKMKRYIPKYIRLEDEQKFYSFVYSCWTTEGVTDWLLHRLSERKFYEDRLDARSHLIYLSCLLESGQKENVKAGLNHHIDKYGENYIEYFLPVANFAHDCGMTNKWISKASYVYKKILGNETKEAFIDYVKDSRIALVGNSQNIIGAGFGQEIDGYDIVTRMNTFRIDERPDDFGRRTDLYVNNANANLLDDTNMKHYSDYRWIYIPADFWHMSFEDVCRGREHDLLDILYDILKEGKVPVISSPQKLRLELIRHSCIRYPSVGLMTIWLIYCIKKELREEWLYGFNAEIKEEGTIEKFQKEDVTVQTRFLNGEKGFSYWKDGRYNHNFNEELRFRRLLETNKLNIGEIL